MAQEIGTHRVTVSRVSTFGDPDPPSLPQVYWREADSTISELPSAGQALVAVLSDPSVNTVRVPFEVAGTATRGVDYELRTSPSLTSPTVSEDVFTFAPGETQAVIYLAPIPDSETEGTEDVKLVFIEENTDGDTLDGAEIGLPVLHTVYIENVDPSADPVVSFAVGSSTLLEGDELESPAVVVDIVLNRAADGGEIVALATGGSAPPSDYTIQPASVQFAEGETQKSVVVRSVGDDIPESDRTVELTLVGLVDLTLGGLSTHTVTILDDDQDTGPPTVAWSLATQNKAEGSGQQLILINVTQGADTHGGINLNVAVVGSGTTAIAGVDYTLDTPTVFIPAATAQGAARVTLPENPDSGDDSTLQLQLTSADANIGTPDTTTINILDSGGAGDFPDGDLFGSLGERLAPEREQFVQDDPHIIVYADRIEVVTDIGGNQGQQIPASFQSKWQVITLAVSAAEPIWKALNPTTWEAAEMGDELNSVRIEMRDREFGMSAQSMIGPDTGRVTFNGGSGGTNPSPHWDTVQSDVGRPVIRDLIFYPEFEGTYRPQMCGIRFGFTTGLVDNLRFERMWFYASPNVASAVGVQRTIDTEFEGQAQGKVKVYDCELRGPDNGAYGTPDHPRQYKWGIRAEGRASWDVRMRPNLPYIFAPSVEEHYIYVDDPVGSATYPKILGNYFIGIRGAFETPPGRTAIQVASRKNSNPGPQGSGDLVYIRCLGAGVGGEIPSGGQGFTIWGHNGRVYLKDCEYLQGPFPAAFGGMGMLSDLAWPEGQNNEPHGIHVFETEPGRIYQCPEVVIDGFTYDVSDQPNNNSRACMKFYGTRIVRLIKFNIINQRGDGISMNVGGYPGLGFVEELDISELRYPDDHPQAGEPYTGPFSQYPGWGPGNRITDGYHLNWLNNGTFLFNSYPLSNTLVDIYADTIIPEQVANRLESSGDGLGTVTAWASDWGALPDLPELEVPNAVSYVSTRNNPVVPVTVRTIGSDSFMCRIRFTVAFGAATTAVNGVDFQVVTPSPVLMLPPQTVDDEWNGQIQDDQNPLLHKVDVDFEVLADWGTVDTRIVEVEVGTQEMEYPKGSNTYVDIGGGGGSGLPPLWDESNTGYTGTLTDYTGDATLTTNGEVIENKRITYQLNINANNITFRNCWFDLTGGLQDYCISNDYFQFGGARFGLVVENCTFNGSSSACILTHGATIRRSLFRDVGSDALKVQWTTPGDPFLMEESCIQRIGRIDYTDQTGAHADGVQTRGDQGGPQTYRQVNFDCIDQGDEYEDPTSCNITQTGAGTITGAITYDECYFGGGQFLHYFTDKGNGNGFPTNWTLTNNVWRTGTWGSGPITFDGPAGTITGNIRGDTLANVDAILAAGGTWS